MSAATTRRRIAVFGAGAWGTALAQAFANSHDIVLWGRDRAQLADIAAKGENRRYLPGIALHPELQTATDFETAARSAELHVVVTPLAGLRALVRQLQHTAPGTALLWACKGIEAGSGRLPHQIIEEERGSSTASGVLSGPSFAAEVARGLPAAITLAAGDADFARDWAGNLHQTRLRIYASTDVIGSEVGGAVKNVIAIATGISDGMGYGLNARAALITRGLAEISRLAVALGGRSETLMGLAGMGDLILTCTGELSRNRRVGLELARGSSLDQILSALGQVAEGVSTAAEVLRLARQHRVDMPLCAAVKALLHQELDIASAVEQLLARDPRHE